MIARYTRPELGRIWSERRKLEAWLEVELAVCEVLGARGVIPPADLEQIRSRASFDLDDVRERERVTNHDVAAFVDAVAASVGDAGRWIHYGLTSSDVLDTGLALQLREAGQQIDAGAQALTAALVTRAREFQNTICAGRTQVVPRDRHAELMNAIALAGASLDRLATEVRHLQRTEVREVEEPFGEGQKGSSAMPHKRNPITCERITGLSRVIRSNAQAALENVALWHERDISHSSVERIIFPDSCTLLDYMLGLLVKLMDGLIVYPENMKRNLGLSLGMWNSQTVLLALIKKGLTREQAYDLVQRNAMNTWAAKHAGATNADFKSQLLSDPEVAKHLTAAELDQL